MADTINTERMAAMLGISPQRLRELTRRGTVPATGRGRYDPFATVPAYVASLREAAAGRGGDGHALDLMHERAALAKAQREKLEREAAQARRELIPAAELASEAFKVHRSIRDAILNIPDRCAPRLASIKDPGEAHAYLFEEITRTLRMLAADIYANPARGAAHG